MNEKKTNSAAPVALALWRGDSEHSMLEGISDRREESRAQGNLQG